MPTRSPQYYERLWRTLQPLERKRRQIDLACRRVLKHRAVYEEVERHTGVPWHVVGALHNLESGCSLTSNLHNGEPWWRKTRLVPKGRGPFASFAESAVDALALKRTLFPREWTLGEIGRFCEAYNGWGYCRRNRNSPYVWGQSNHGLRCGKFISDGKYDAMAQSDQIGALVILNQLNHCGECQITLASAHPAVSPAVPAADTASE